PHPLSPHSRRDGGLDAPVGGPFRTAVDYGGPVKDGYTAGIAEGNDWAVWLMLRTPSIASSRSWLGRARDRWRPSVGEPSRSGLLDPDLALRERPGDPQLLEQGHVDRAAELEAGEGGHGGQVGLAGLVEVDDAADARDLQLAE